MELGRYYRIYEWPHAANLRSGSYYLYTFPIWAKQFTLILQKKILPYVDSQHIVHI